MLSVTYPREIGGGRPAQEWHSRGSRFEADQLHRKIKGLAESSLALFLLPARMQVEASFPLERASGKQAVFAKGPQNCRSHKKSGPLGPPLELGNGFCRIKYFEAA
jgi:hypothetical protein